MLCGRCTTLKQCQLNVDSTFWSLNNVNRRCLTVCVLGIVFWRCCSLLFCAEFMNSLKNSSNTNKHWFWRIKAGGYDYVVPKFKFVQRQWFWLSLFLFVVLWLPSGHTTLKEHRFKVDLTSWRWVNVKSTLFQRCLPAGFSLRHLVSTVLSCSLFYYSV